MLSIYRLPILTTFAGRRAELMTKAGSTIFCLPPTLYLTFFALTKEEAENLEREGISLDRKWKMCMERKTEKEEVVDPVAKGLVNDLARHMSCLQEQVDQVKRQLLQLILNQIVNTDKAATEVEPEGKSCSENATEKENFNIADTRPLSMCVEKTRKEGSKEDTGIACQTHCLSENVSSFLPSSQRMAGVGDNESKVSDEQSKAKVHHEHKVTMNNMGVVKSKETACALQGVVTIRPRIIKRQSKEGMAVTKAVKILALPGLA